jgi:hypothetical protein
MYIKTMCVVILLMCLSCILFCQTPASVPIERKLGIGISLFYYHPNIDVLNTGFAQAESDRGLPAWKDFNVSYLVVPTISFKVDHKDIVSLQAGGSYAIRLRDVGKSYYYIWMIGGEYQHIALASSWNKLPMELRLSVGAGLMAAQFYRTYGNNVGIYAYSRKPYIDGGVAIGYDLNKRMSLNVDARYLFVPTVKFYDLQTELKLSSFMIGIGCNYLL